MRSASPPDFPIPHGAAGDADAHSLPLWVALCIVAGVAIGQFLPAVPETLSGFTIAQVNLPVAVLQVIFAPFIEAGLAREYVAGAILLGLGDITVPYNTVFPSVLLFSFQGEVILSAVSPAFTSRR